MSRHVSTLNRFSDWAVVYADSRGRLPDPGEHYSNFEYDESFSLSEWRQFIRRVQRFVDELESFADRVDHPDRTRDEFARLCEEYTYRDLSERFSTNANYISRTREILGIDSPRSSRDHEITSADIVSWVWDRRMERDDILEKLDREYDLPNRTLNHFCAVFHVLGIPRRVDVPESLVGLVYERVGSLSGTADVFGITENRVRKKVESSSEFQVRDLTRGDITEQEVVEAYRETESIRQVSNRFDTTDSTILSRLRSAGVETGKPGHRQHDDEEVRQLRRRYCFDLEELADLEDREYVGPTSNLVRGETYKDVGGPVTRLGHDRDQIENWIDCDECGRPVGEIEAEERDGNDLCPICLRNRLLD